MINEQPMLPFLSIRSIEGKIFLHFKIACIKEITYYFKEILTGSGLRKVLFDKFHVFLSVLNDLMN